MTRPSFAGGQTNEVKKQKKTIEKGSKELLKSAGKSSGPHCCAAAYIAWVASRGAFFFFLFFSNDENGRWQGSVTHPRCSSVYTQHVKADVVYNRGSLSAAQSQSYIAAIQHLYGVRVAELLSCELFGLCRHKLGAQHTHGDILSRYRYV